MPTLSRCFLRGGLLSLAIGTIPGGLILLQKGTGWYPGLWVLLPAHTYLVLIGGLSQCALGVCYWIFPRFAGGASRGNTTLAWCSYGMLNAALGLMVLHPLLQVLYGNGAASVAFIGAGLLQGLAALTFVWHIWPRIRPSSTVARRSG
jgi:hypothetical protein